MTFITLAVITALCLAIPPFRAYALIGVGMLIYFYSYLTLGVLLLSGIAFIYLRRRKPRATL